MPLLEDPIYALVSQVVLLTHGMLNQDQPLNFTSENVLIDITESKMF